MTGWHHDQAAAPRTDIEALRGLAVLLVVLYHAHVPGFGGGYIGVDVFFVISGYLMARMLAAPGRAGRLGYADFIARRLRRLAPAAILAQLATLVAAMAVQGPLDLQRTAVSTLWASAYLSNIFFWRHQGYFADLVPEQPLLHTWSLAVEVQFYLLVPLLLMRGLGPQRERTRNLWLIVLAAVSLALCIGLTGNHPSASFYTLPTRAWQFLVGAGAYRLVLGRDTTPRLARGLGLLGWVGILTAAATLTSSTPFPGVAALWPTLGAALVVASGAATAATAAPAPALGRPMIALGRISYSVYLWHWPIFALTRYHLARELMPAETAAALAASLLAGWMSQRWIERPFRRAAASQGPTPRSLAPVGWAAASAGLLAGLVLAAHGLPQRLDDRALRYHRAGSAAESAFGQCHRVAPLPQPGPPPCLLADSGPAAPAVLVWGDSHANAIAPAWRQLGRQQGLTVWQASLSSCPPLLGARVARVPFADHCRRFNDEVMGWMREHRVRRVVLAAYWSAYLPPTAEPPLSRGLDPYSGEASLRGGDAAANRTLFTAAMRRTMAALADAGIEPWVLRQIPVHPDHVPLLLSRAVALGTDPLSTGIPLATHRQQTEAVDRAIDEAAAGVRRLDPAGLLCTGTRCDVARGPDALYIDAHHLSVLGALALVPMFGTP